MRTGIESAHDFSGLETTGMLANGTSEGIAIGGGSVHGKSRYKCGLENGAGITVSLTLKEGLSQHLVTSRQPECKF